MREIKFRAWHKEKRVMIENVFGIDFVERFIFGVVYQGDRIKFSDCEIMQFTGLKDINGKEIFEWDIVRLLCDGEKIICKVRREKTYYTLDGGILGAGELQTENIEVIGNIYENPKLLDEEEKFETKEDYIKLHKRQAFGK